MRPMFEGEIVYIQHSNNHFFKEGLSVRLLSEITFNNKPPEIVGVSPNGVKQWLKYNDFRPFYDEE